MRCGKGPAGLFCGIKSILTKYSLEAGKLADLILVSSDSPEQYPNYDPMITLAEATVGPHVQTVIIDGRPIRSFKRSQIAPIVGATLSLPQHVECVLEFFLLHQNGCLPIFEDR